MRSFGAEILIGIAILAVFFFIAAGTPAGRAGGDWVDLQHESGGIYVVRKSAIIGYTIPPAGSSLKPSILLSGGATISTGRKYTADEFRELME